MNYMNLLKEHGLKATPQRISVLKILNRHMHPTIDELYEEICAENPSVSLATVYKNLNMLKDEGLVVEVNMPNQKARYDIFEEPHVHVVCEKCGNVRDVAYSDICIDYCKEKLENKLENIVERINVLATTKNCTKCR